VCVTCFSCYNNRGTNLATGDWIVHLIHLLRRGRDVRARALNGIIVDIITTIEVRSGDRRLSCSSSLGRLGPINLEPGTMRVYVTNGPRNGLNIGGKVGPCPGSRRRWVLGSVHAVSQTAHAPNTYRPRFQVRPRPSYLLRRRPGVNSTGSPAQRYTHRYIHHNHRSTHRNEHGNDSGWSHL